MNRWDWVAGQYRVFVTTSQTSTQRRSLARTAVVWDALVEVLAPLTEATVVDIGGGTGGFAVRVAELGHRVTVVDPNPDALAILGRRAGERGVAERVTGIQGDLAGVADLVAPASADVVLCHGVLEIVEDPAAALSAIAALLRPGGALSLLVQQRHAAVLARAMAGHFSQAQALLELDAATGAAVGRFSAEEIRRLIEGAGLGEPVLHAVRVFVDLVPSTLVDLEPGAADALVALERAASARAEYLALAAQIHALAYKG
ncbi:MAG: methyltransferase domain-containing protein [Nocardioidaceae bacterium]